MKQVYTYDIDVPAQSPEEAFEKLTAVSVLLEKLETETLQQIAETVSNPVKLAVIKLKLGLK